jgi:hypothetical protein
MQSLLLQLVQALNEILWSAGQTRCFDELWRDEACLIWIEKAVMTVVQALMPHRWRGFVEPCQVALPDGSGVLWRLFSRFQMPRYQVVYTGKY